MKGRQRGRNGGKPRMHHQGGGGRNGNFDHNAGRMRGNAQQLMDKFLALGRDASAQGDRVLAENYFQHADHYYRVVNARFEGQQQQNQHRRFNNGQPGGYDGQDGQGGYNDYNRSDLPPGPSQNLIPNGVQTLDPGSNPPSQNAPQPQQGYENNYQPQPQSQPQHHESDGDIGLPPQLFGGQTQPPDGGQGQAEPQQSAPAAGNEGRGFRPRHGGRRRFGGRRDGQQAQSEPTGEPT